MASKSSEQWIFCSANNKPRTNKKLTGHDLSAFLISVDTPPFQLILHGRTIFVIHIPVSRKDLRFLPTIGMDPQLIQMGGTYTLGADGIYYPSLSLPEEEEPRYGKYGRMRHTYLKEHRQAHYTTLLFDGKLVTHLNEVDAAAHQRMELLTQQMAKAQGVTEALKEKDQLAWVGAMNNIRTAAEEIILSELIYI